MSIVNMWCGTPPSINHKSRSTWGLWVAYVAAIDRIIHHATIIEIDADSYRRKEQKKKK
nr:ATP-binding protein [Granulosicoccus sp.]